SWSKHPTPKPTLTQVDPQTVSAIHPQLGARFLVSDRAVPWLFTENETNTERVFGIANASPYVKDGIDRRVVHGEEHAGNPARAGTKAAAHYEVTVPGGGAVPVRLRLGPDQAPATAFGDEFDGVVTARQREADEFYDSVIPSHLPADERLVVRQAFAGMLWSKQFYYYPVNKWLNDEVLPPDCHRRVATRNSAWFTLDSADVISMPDKWEYPWFAAWDLAFHCMVLARVDLDFAKAQLRLMTNQVYLHPSGQMPAYEWNFSDVNPPVHCKATWEVYLMEKFINGKG